MEQYIASGADVHGLVPWSLERTAWTGLTANKIKHGQRRG